MVIITALQEDNVTLSRDGDSVKVKVGESREVTVCTMEQLPTLRNLIEAMVSGVQVAHNLVPHPKGAMSDPNSP